MDGTQRRRFTRIRFQSTARFRTSTAACECEVCDLSLKGAMVAPLEATQARIGDPCALELRLDGDEARVCMEGEVAHMEGGHIGMVCREIDLDSITHLRRLIELNLGDPQLLNRELSALISK